MSVVVVGLGNISKRHRENIRTMCPDEEIVSVSASGKIDGRYLRNSDNVVARLEDVDLDDVSFAVIASPATKHLDHASQLAKFGVPLYIEKPLAATTDDCKSLMEVAYRNGVKSKVGYCLRFMDSAKKMHELINSRFLGDIYHVYINVGQYLPDWRVGADYRDSVSAKKELGGGALLELSHELDYLQWIFGKFRVKYSRLSFSKDLQINVEDQVDVVLVGEKEEVAYVHLDFLQRGVQRRCEVIGKNGRLIWDLVEDKVSFAVAGGVMLLHSPRAESRNYMYLAAMQDFFNEISGEMSFGASLVEASKTIQLIDEIRG